MHRSEHATDKGKESSSTQRMLFDPNTGTHKPVVSSARSSSRDREQQRQQRQQQQQQQQQTYTILSRNDAVDKGKSAAVQNPKYKDTGFEEEKKKKQGKSHDKRRNRRQAAEEEAKAQPVVPKILVRPERALDMAARKGTVQLLVRQPQTSSPIPPTPPQMQRAQQPERSASPMAVAASVSAVDHHGNRESLVAKQVASRASIGCKIPLLSHTGKLNVNTAKRHLGSLQHRSCIGVLGRSSVGKSLIMSKLAHRYAQNCIFRPSAASGSAPNANGETIGIDLCVNGGRTLLLDSPPVLSIQASEGWMKRSEINLPRHTLSRLRDLQLVSLLLQICDTLLVVVNTKKGASSALEEEGGIVDTSIARLLSMASNLVPSIPGLIAPCRPQASQESVERKGSRLHIVVNDRYGFKRQPGLPCMPSAKDIAKAYEEASGIAVAGVSFIAHRDPRRELGGRVPRSLDFKAIANDWSLAAPRQLPLYPSEINGTARQAGRSLLSWNLLDSSKRECSVQSCDGTSVVNTQAFEACVEQLSTCVLSSGSSYAAGFEERQEPEAEGAWMARCVRAWESIRRSDQLQDLASVRDAVLDVNATYTAANANIPASKTRKPKKPSGSGPPPPRRHRAKDSKA